MEDTAGRTGAGARFAGFGPLSANFTPTPNQFFDLILDEEDCVVKVVGHLVRATLGWEDPRTGERRVEAALPLSEFVRRGMARGSARKGLGLAAARGYIVKTRAEDARSPARYALRWDDAAGQREAVRRERLRNGPAAADIGVGLGADAGLGGCARSGGSKNDPLRRGPDFDPPTRGSQNDPVKIWPARGSKFAPPKKRKKRKEESTLSVADGPVARETQPEGQTVTGEDRVGCALGDKPPEGSPGRAAAGPGPVATWAEEARAGVGGDAGAARAEATRPPRPASAREGWLERQAEALAAELQDRGSERRHRQLLSICEEHGLTDLAGEALAATRRRLARPGPQGPLERPGAYYTRVLLRLLGERQVFVPRAGEEDAGEVRRLARESLGLAAEDPGCVTEGPGPPAGALVREGPPLPVPGAGSPGPPGRFRPAGG